MATPMPRGYRSATEYHFPEEQADAIVRTTAYHRRDFNLSVVWFSPREHAGIRPSIATPFRRASHTGLGPLDQLPLELLHDVFLRLDMRSLFTLRQANLRSRQTIDSLTQYQMVVSHGLNLFCALLRTRLALHVSLFDFYDVLCTKACAFCGEFGGFVSLLVWNRCCFECLSSRTVVETQVRTFASVHKAIRLGKAERARLKTFKILPGKYTGEESVIKARFTVVSVHQAAQITASTGKYLAKPDAAAFLRGDHNPTTTKYNFMGSCALPYYDRRTGQVEHGMSCAGCQLALEKGIIGYSGKDWEYKARDKVYARDGFLGHFRWCQQAQLLWRSSDEGKIRPPELPVLARRRGFFNGRE